MYSTSDYSQQVMHIEETGIVVMHNVSRFSAYGTDILCPHMSLMLIESGSTKVLYDQEEMTQKQHEIACLLPGHILHPLESSKDFSATIVLLSHKLYNDLQFHTFSHDYKKFNITPVCPLTELQANQIASITEQLSIIANHSEEELPHRYEMMLAILAVGYEYLNLYRREQDRDWQTGRYHALYRQFCELVVKHYKESREVQFYADLVHLTPKHFTKVIRQETNGISPAKWIEQYVVAQAKRLMDTKPDCSIQEIAFQIGFTEATTFHRYFKRVTGITAKEYRKKIY